VSQLATSLDVRRARRALALVVAGLAVQLGCAFFWTPGTFILSALVGMPLVLAGALLGWLSRSRAESGGGMAK
jgi:hypothetical protein